MAQLQIPIDDELMRKLKMFAADNGTTLKQLVPDILNRHFTPMDDGPAPKVKAKETPKPTPKPVLKEVRQPEPVVEPAPFRPTPTGTTWTPKEYPNPLEYEPTDEDLYYILRKTAKTKHIKDYAQFQYGPIHWMVFDGHKAHYDKNGDPIPHRCTTPEGLVVEPDAEQLKEMENLLGKPVKIEK